MLKKIFFMLLFVITSCSVYADTSVWKVSAEDNYIYIGGTCHLLRASDFPLPEEFEIAYKHSSTLVFESDIHQMQTPSAQQLLLSRVLLQGKTLKDVLSSEVYEELSGYCSRVGLPIDGIQYFKPSMAMMTLVLLELQKLGINQEGVDIHFYNKGTQDKREIKTFESVEEQIEFLVSMGKADEDAFVLHSIQDMKNVKEMFPKMIAAWKKGDRWALQNSFIHSMKRDFPTLYQELIVDRNNKWMPKIESFLKSNRRTFVLVGVGHLVGIDGLLSKLEALGYTVERVSTKNDP